MNSRILQNIAIAGLFGCIALLGLRGGRRVEASQPFVTLSTEPPLSDVVPFKQSVKIILAAQDAQGTVFKNVKFKLKLLTPPTNPWFTTDFPMVEGTQLLDLEVNSTDGTLALEQVFPIRGAYQLGVEVKPQSANAFAPISQTFTLSVPENALKYRNLLVLAIILISVGWVGGWVIGAGQPIQSGELVPRQVRLLLSGSAVVAIATLLAVNISAELAESHNHGHDSHATAHEHAPSEVQFQGLKLKLSGDHYATVGELARFNVAATDTKTTKPFTDAMFRITTTQLEDHEQTVAFQGSSGLTGQQTWQQQFFDGAPHRVQVEVLPKAGAGLQFKPFKVSQGVDVAGVAPPLQTRLISLGYFVGLVGLGLAVGLGQQTIKRKGVGQVVP